MGLEIPRTKNENALPQSQRCCCCCCGGAVIFVCLSCPPAQQTTNRILLVYYCHACLAALLRPYTCCTVVSTVVAVVGFAKPLRQRVFHTEYRCGTVRYSCLLYSARKKVAKSTVFYNTTIASSKRGPKDIYEVTVFQYVVNANSSVTKFLFRIIGHLSMMKFHTDFRLFYLNTSIIQFALSYKGRYAVKRGSSPFRSWW